MSGYDEAEVISEDEMKTALTQVFKRAQTDFDFRKICLTNPGQAIFEITGKRLPEGASLNFNEPEDTQDPRDK